jgi:ankyrin repeat protein
MSWRPRKGLRLSGGAIFAASVAMFFAVACESSQSPEIQFLFHVSGNNRQRVQQVLNRKLVDVNFQTQSTKTSALEISGGQGYVEMTKMLLSRGADPNIRNSSGMTPLRLAAYEGHTQIVQMLLQAGAKPDLSDYEYGYTPLAGAASKGHIDVVKLLLNAGADKRILNSTGKSAAVLASENDHRAVFELLVAPPNNSPGARP